MHLKHGLSCIEGLHNKWHAFTRLSLRSLLSRGQTCLLQGVSCLLGHDSEVTRHERDVNFTDIQTITDNILPGCDLVYQKCAQDST